MTCISITSAYDELIVPHLQRMSNLKKLALNLHIDCREIEVFVDGNNLKKNIISHMPRLNDFVFNIRSIISLHNQMYLPSNEDIQRTFTSFKNHQVISRVDYFSKDKSGHCHIYTYPYTMTYYENITNNFPGGLFKNVYDIELLDERSFEHTFFIRIAQAFPFLKYLTISNRHPQNDKTQDVSIIEYPHLITLHLLSVHEDYAEQFLFDTKTCLPSNINLIIDHDLLERVTHNFTRDATRINYSKVKHVQFHLKPNPLQYV